MKKTYEMKVNPEYNNIQNNLSSPELYNNYLPQEFEPNLIVIYSYNIIIIILKQALNECSNINEIIRISLKSLTDTVKSQGIAIRDLSKKLSNKPSREELDNYLKFKSNNNDEIFQAINNCVNINQFNDLIHQFENLKNDIFLKLNKYENNLVTKDDFAIIKNELDNKANILDIENALEAKEDKEKINFLNKNMVDKNEINKMINNAMNTNDEKNISRNDFEQFLDDYQNDYKNIEEKLMNKLDINNYQNTFEKLRQKIDNIDNDLDRLIQSVKDQFQAVNFAINNLEQNFVDKNELNLNMEKIIRNKIEKDQVELLINKSKNNMLDIINQFKSGENSNQKNFEENIQNKIDKMIFDNQSLLNDITNTNQNINNYFSQKQAEMENLMNKMRTALSNNNNINALSNKKELDNKILEKLDGKLDIVKFEEFLNGLKEDLDAKLDIITMKKTNEEIIQEINDKIRQLYTDINKDLSQKINKNELDAILSENNFRSINNNINDISQEKLSITDFEEFVNNINQQLKQKLDINKFNNIISTFNSNFENIHKDMNSKADLKNIINILKSKLDIENFNDEIKILKKEVGGMTPLADFSSAMDNQAIINDTLCNENNIGRWLWKSGKIKNNLAIPWEVQIINTSNDNFLWEKDKTFINIKEGGLYEIKMGFFADKKPMVQILINGEVIISAINSNSYVIHQSPGGRMKGTGKTSFGNVTGLTMVDFVLLPDNAKLSISYTGEKGIGFLGLKKL